jgi:hypothetical protein
MLEEATFRNLLRDMTIWTSYSSLVWAEKGLHPMLFEKARQNHIGNKKILLQPKLQCYLARLRMGHNIFCQFVTSNMLSCN